jgi:hypothetical protein
MFTVSSNNFFNWLQSYLIKLSNELTSDFLWNWRNLPLKYSICYVRHLEKTPEELVCLNGIGGFRRKRGCGRWWMTWPSGNSEKWWKGEDSCKRDYCVGIWMNLPVFSQETNWCLNILCTNQILPLWLFYFPKIEKFTQRNPFSVNWRHP